MGFIKSTDHRSTDHRPFSTHRPTDPPTHRPTDQIITDTTNKVLFKRLDNRMTSTLQNTNTAGEIKNYTSVYYVFDDWISNFKRLQKKTIFL